MSQEVSFCDRNVEASRVSRLLVLRQKLQVAAIQFCKNILNYQQIMKKVQFSSGKICWPSTRRKKQKRIPTCFRGDGDVVVEELPELHVHVRGVLGVAHTTVIIMMNLTMMTMMIFLTT